jgi:hypothetical protein
MMEPSKKGEEGKSGRDGAMRREQETSGDGEHNCSLRI